MKISYKKLWKLLIDKSMKKIGLLEKVNISTSKLAKLGKDEYVSMDVLVKVYTALNINIGVIVELVEEDTY